MCCWYALPLLLLPSLSPAPSDEQPCTNGSFEQLDTNGFPVDWSPVGDTVGVSTDAHEGQRSLRLLRTPESKAAETGLNRGWRPGVGSTTLGQLSGGIDFYYKAVRATGAQLMIYVIPMNQQSVERTASRRAEYRVPDDHIGDGKWHHARLKYDFTKDPQVTSVHFAARILGSAGEILLDDFAYVPRTGPILRFGQPRIEEDPAAPGQRCTLRVPLSSDGDEPARAVTLGAALPAGLQLVSTPAETADLDAGQRTVIRMNIEGPRKPATEILLTARAGTNEAEARVVLQPRLEVVNVGPTQPLTTVGKPIAIECVLKNSGNATLPPTEITFLLPTGVVKKMAEPIPPGTSQMIASTFVPTSQSAGQSIVVEVTGHEGGQPIRKESTLIVGPDTTLAGPADSLHCNVSGTCAILENTHLRCVFRHCDFGWGPAELYVHKDDAWPLVAQLPRLARLVALDGDEGRFEQTIVSAEPPQAATDADHAELTIHATLRDKQGAEWQVTERLSLAADAHTLLVRHELRCTLPRRLLAFDGPVLYVLERDEAVFPGLEWLVDDEVSSSTLDIALGHADQVRYVVHPNMITIPAIGIHARWGTLGLLWDVHQKWDGVHDRPSVLFASPDQFDNQRSHVAGLFLPGVPDWVHRNRREAEVPHVVNPDQPLRLECRILADVDGTDALTPIDAWIDWREFPEPAPLPHGSYEDEIAFSMQGYLKSLWIPETREWWTSKGGGILSSQGRPSAYAADLLVGAILSPDADVQQACRDRAAEVVSIIGGPARIDYLRFGQRSDLALANPSLIAGLLNSRNENGMWGFDADRLGTGPFEGVDYRDLGPHNAVEVGTTAQRAYQVLRYARLAGDRKAYELMLPTLERMSTFRVPRAAQVWEVPVHTPDVLAASNAMDAYLEAYRFSGDRRWLDEAVVWARRGLPFIYLWDDPEHPFLVGASIPVFGATWYQGSWFGRPVQWNGLCYADSLLRLAEYDQHRDWRKLAEAIIRSAIHQQDQQGENAALWPDNLSAIDGEKCAWVFAPRQIIQNILKFTHRDEDPATVIMGEGANRLHISSTATLSEIRWDGRSLELVAAYPVGEQGCIVISNVTRPSRVVVAGREVSERMDVELSDAPGWRYDPANGFLTIRITQSGPANVIVQGAAFRDVTRLPEIVKQLAFEFRESTDGWSEAHDVLETKCEGGILIGNITGPDPYVIRTMMDVPADSCRAIALRIRLTAGRGGQLFWTTKASPSFDESKSIYIPLVADGQFHELRIDVGAHPLWRGEVTGLRIDPGGGAAAGEFGIDYVRSTK